MQESLQQEENNRALGKGKEKDGDKKDPFWKKMGLPTDQTCVEYFACCNSQMKVCIYVCVFLVFYLIFRFLIIFSPFSHNKIKGWVVVCN